MAIFMLLRNIISFIISGSQLPDRRVCMKQKLIQSVNHEIARGKAKWGEVDKSPELLLIAATEELVK